MSIQQRVQAKVEALASRPAQNARIATVLFSNSEPLRWLHVHETWLPESVALAGPYDF